MLYFHKRLIQTLSPILSDLGYNLLENVKVFLILRKSDNATSTATQFQYAKIERIIA